jgi:hypothetical protein
MIATHPARLPTTGGSGPQRSEILAISAALKEYPEMPQRLSTIDDGTCSYFFANKTCREISTARATT